MRLAEAIGAAALAAAAAQADWGPASRLPDTVNSPYYDWGVCASADGNTIYFASNRENPGSLECDIYISYRVGNSWSAAAKVPGPINTADEEGSPCLSWDDQRIYFQRGKLYPPDNDLDIWASDWTGSAWGEPYKIPGQVNTADHWEWNAGVSGDGLTLYFVGQSWPGNLAMYNIWSSRWTGSEWGTPKFLSDINTTEQEGDPAPTYDGKYLYFWSGRSDISDIYRARAEGSGWGTPEKLGPNVNVAHNAQCDPFVTEDGRYLFFSRCPPSGGNYDLYVSEWVSEPAVAPASLGRIKVLFR